MKRMAGELPKFDSPPVIETVLGVQFAPLPNFSTVHSGWFWKNYLGEDWTSVKVVPRLDDHFERFGEEPQWTPLGLRIHTKLEEGRAQIIRNDDERMI